MDGLNTRRAGIALGAAGLMLVVMACLCGQIESPQLIEATVGAAQATVGAAQKTLAPVLTVAGSSGGLGTVVAGAEVHQWAANAGGSSQRSAGDFSFSQVTGLPNTPACGDTPTAWASDPNEKTPILTLDYATAVIPTHIVIHHSFNPGWVSKVDVSDGSSLSLTVFQGSPFKIDQCPYEQTIDIQPGTVPFAVTEVVISLDQTSAPGPDEIDAVELVGIAQ